MTQIDGETRIVAILGDPIAQAKSPQLFNALFERHGVNAALVPFHVPATSLGTVLEGLRGVVNLAGVVVTVPHKLQAAAHATHLSAAAQQTGAANCLRREADGSWTGAMFDGSGFVSGLYGRGREMRGKSALIVGTGGAGVAVAHALIDAGIASIDLFDSNSASLQRLAQALRARGSGTVIRESVARAQAVHDLVVNATPCGMRPGDPMPLDLADAGPHAVIADLIMKPAETPLLEEAKARGLAVHPGRYLLENSVEAMAAFLRLIAST
ncbi:shikimate dehydrogenase family protein [Paraburkholderia domus]|uniref:shikimate dehydrogenase family protein n=1 Tax=Paraburkholderia domus TaxID=2793075 RepID=UPI0019144ED3|nr:shikimate dehydrogenase [Paraburkholderia domus]MBK5065966.1 shikimate dehydrogenase [Burkholderia sp. R-70199]CAE6965389.1 Shikimate dehydrogenase (NADP(+)) [Paraburkholderia domus]